MSGRCRDCKHWTLEAQVPAGRALYGEPIVPRLGHCGRWHEGYGVRRDDVADNEAWVEDDEGWGNATGPDFGCVLFETRS
jgi:hypothetical protein